MSDKQATDLVILDLRPVSLITDFFVIGTAESAPQMRAVARVVEERAREDAGAKPVVTDGEPDSGWILIDFGDVIAHVFDPGRRSFYQLESLWDEAPLVARMA